MIIACLVAVAVAAVPSLSSSEDFAAELATARGFGGIGAVTGTPDGRFLFTAEGAAIAIFEPGGGPRADRSLATPLKKFELGAARPHVVRMALDPEADLGDGSSLAKSGHPGYRNLLFLAAGHNGLWVVDADVNPRHPNRIARVDDSGDVPAFQTSARHCNDVDVATFGGETFVVATFAAAGDSQLRLYRIEDVRAVLAAASHGAPETGREIAPALSVRLGRYMEGTPFTALSVGPNQIARSFASDLVVDQGAPEADELFLYVAMRTDGVVRVRLRRTDVVRGRIAPDAVVWGPRFGDSSAYATLAPGDGATDNRAVYDDVRWVNQQFATARLERSDPPYVTSLAVYRSPATRDSATLHKLYVGVDALGIVVFDIANPSSWGVTMPIDHHEGEPFDLQGGAQLQNPGAWPERLVGARPVLGATSVRDLIGYVRDMAVVETGRGPRLVASYTGLPSFADSPLFMEGFAYDDQFQYGAVTYLTPMRGARRGFTRVYDVRDFPVRSAEVRLTPHLEFDVGGRALFVPSAQSNRLAAPNPGNRIEFAHVDLASLGMRSVALVPDRGTKDVELRRERGQIAGRRTFGLQQSLVDPDLIMTSDNDGHPREGLLYLAGSTGARSLVVDYDARAEGGNDRRLSTGVIMGRRSQWLDHRLGSDQQAILGGGRPRPGGGGLPAQRATHTVAIQTIPRSIGGSPRVGEFKVNLIQMPDRWNRTGRAFYLGGMVDPQYDAWVQEHVPGHDGAEYFFLFRQETPDGIVFGRRDALMDLVTGGGVEDGDFVSPDALLASGVGLRVLNTHPEFDGFPHDPGQDGYRAAVEWFAQATAPHPYRQRVKTWDPEMIRVRPGKESTLDAGWVLAVPCGVGVLGSSENPNVAEVSLLGSEYKKLDEVAVPDGNGGTVVGDVDWLPEAGGAADRGVNRGLVQFWDFSDPSRIPVASGKPDGSSTLPPVYLPIAAEETPDPSDVGRSSFAWHLEGLEVERGGERHSFAIVGDFIGGVHAYDISSILRGEAPKRVASWYPPLSLQDSLTNNVRDVIVDREAESPHVYVAIQRVGVVVLRAEIDDSGHVQFDEVRRIDDIKEPLTMHLRVIPESGERLLYVCDHRQSMRVYTSLPGAARPTLAKDQRGLSSPKTLPASLTERPGRDRARQKRRDRARGRSR
ncbi:MAG: hypothetical protein AAGB93_02070 [Planctomycetota bacterium]